MAETPVHVGTICSEKNGCDRIGVAWPPFGLYWGDSTLLAVQTDGNHPCGQIRTPLGLAAEPGRFRGCYSVLWNGIADSGFRPVWRTRAAARGMWSWFKRAIVHVSCPT